MKLTWQAGSEDKADVPESNAEDEHRADEGVDEHHTEEDGVLETAPG